VLTQEPLDDLVPIEPAAMDDRRVIEWDKDDIDALGFMKVDVLGSACSAACAALRPAEGASRRSHGDGRPPGGRSGGSR
jgi:hypothetical protein